MAAPSIASAGAPGRHGLTAPGRPLAPFASPAFRILLGSSMALQVGSWVQTIGQGWLVKNDLNGSAANLAMVALLRGAALVLLSPLGGYLGGRFDRRKQLLVYTTVSAGIAALLAGLVGSGNIELWMVYCTAVAAGTVDALAGPIRSMLVFDTVEHEDVTNAVALNALGGNAMRVIGPAIGGALIAVVGTQGTFQLQAVCLVFAAVLTWFLAPAPPEATAGAGMFRSMAGGLVYVWRDRTMLLIVLMAIIPSVLVYPYVTFLPVFAIDVMHGGEGAYGLLAAAVGLGSLLGGALVVFSSNSRGLGPRMMWSCLLYCVSIGAFTFATGVWAGIAILSVAGIFHSIYSAMNASLMQLEAEPEYRSRVLSLQTMTWGITPFAGLLMGEMIDRWGAPHVVFTWVAIAACLTAALLVGSRSLRRV